MIANSYVSWLNYIISDLEDEVETIVDVENKKKTPEVIIDNTTVFTDNTSKRIYLKKYSCWNEHEFKHRKNILEFVVEDKTSGVTFRRLYDVKRLRCSGSLLSMLYEENQRLIERKIEQHTVTRW
jgi:hypothetical protein